MPTSCHCHFWQRKTLLTSLTCMPAPANTTIPSSPLPPSFDALLLPLHSPTKHALTTIFAKAAGARGNVQFPTNTCLYIIRVLYHIRIDSAHADRKLAVRGCVLMMFHERFTLVFVNCTGHHLHVLHTFHFTVMS